MTEKNEITADTSPSGHLHEAPMVVELGETFGLAPKQIINVLRSIVKVPKGAPPPTAAELVVALSVIHQYKMNPMMGQIHFWRDNNGELAKMMGYDGWTQKANEQPGYRGVSYEYGPEVQSPDGKGKVCWEYITVTVHDSIRGDMKMVPVYLDEFYKEQRGNYPMPWQKQTRHKLHVVAFRMAIREMYGVGLDVRDPEDFAAYKGSEEQGASTHDKLREMDASMNHEEPQAATDADYEEIPDPLEMARAESPSEPPAVPCGVSGCAKGGEVKCVGCEAYFCPEHVDDGDVCGVCGLDG